MSVSTVSNPEVPMVEQQHQQARHLVPMLTRVPSREVLKMGLVNSYVQATIRIGDPAPDFTARSSHGELNFRDYKRGKWCLFFSHPLDFTPVCTTELGYVQRILTELEGLNTCVVGVSCDTVDSHVNWIADINETQGVSISFPIVADDKRLISQLYGMLDQTNEDMILPFTVRSTYIIDPENVIRLILIYPLTCGRNFDEILRCLRSLQLTDRHHSKVSTPADWIPGEPVVVNHEVPDAEARALFGEVEATKPYFRKVQIDENTPI